MRIVFIILSIFIMITCKDKKTGTYKGSNDKFNYKVYYPSNQIKIVSDTLKGGKLHGVYKKYYKSGRLNIKAEVDSGNLDGQKLVFYPNGNIKRDLFYKSGKFIGPQFEYYNQDSGVIKKKLFYIILDNKDYIINKRTVNKKGIVVSHDNSRVV